MGKLGVKATFDFETNKRIIAQKYLENPDLTMKQVKYLLCVWKPSGNYEYAKKLYLWLLRQDKKSLKALVGGGKDEQSTLKAGRF